MARNGNIDHNKKKATVTTVVLALVFVFAATSASFDILSYADEKSELEDRLNETKQGVKDAKSEYRKKKKKEESLGDKIAGLEASIAKAEKELKSLGREIKQNGQDLTRIELDVARLEAEVGTQNSELMERLRVMYVMRESSMIEVLLGSENILDFLTNLDMIQRIHAQDVKTLEELNRKLNLVESKKAELVEIKTKLESQRKAEKQKKAKLASDKKELAAEKVKAGAEAAEALENLEEMEEASKAIEEELKKLKSRGNYGGGKMGWPVNGSVTSEFGWRVHPISHVRRLHAGIDIAAPTGTPVHAAADGVVVKSSHGWNGGYGNVAIIDHGSGIMTLYGHNASLTAASGTNVKRGDVIAYVGSTGNSTGPHCHFEVRVNGVAQNPRSWL